MKTREIALTGLMTALVLVVTRSFIIPIPQTKGFFNIGEAAVYLAALLFGPRIGAFAGGVGSALADVSLGFTSFAPFTLVIKGIEGYVVGALGEGRRPVLTTAGAVLGLIAGVWALFVPTASVESAGSWLVRSAGAVAVVAALAALVLTAREPTREAGLRVGAMLLGGLLMVTGYFIAEAYLMGLGVPTALVEVPYNIVQMTVGVVVGTVAAATFKEALLAQQPR